MARHRRPSSARARLGTAVLAGITLAPWSVSAQQRLPSMPGFDRYAAVAPQLRGAVVSGALRGGWDADGLRWAWSDRDGRWAWIAAADTVVRLEAETDSGPDATRDRPARGRQYTEAVSPDGAWTALYRDRNVVLVGTDGSERPVTTEGDTGARTKFGSASWVYGEELGQNTALWWSHDSRRLAFYGFDEGPVRDYYLQLDQTRIQSTVDVEAYPKAGTDNPVVDLYVFDRATGATVRVDVRDGAPWGPDVAGYYVYGVEWSPDGSELLIHRTNRLQNVLELAACDPEGGACRTVVREEWPTGWVDLHPELVWLSDGRRFVWATEASGWRNYELRDLDGRRLAVLTDHPFEVAGVERIDETAGRMWYRARSGDNPMKLQLHRVDLDGGGEARLTDPAFHHTVDVAPGGLWIVDVAETHDTPPATRILDGEGRVVRTLRESDTARWDELGLRPVERFEFRAADDTTVLHGLVHRPSDFDPARSYPLLVSVYAGPGTNGAREQFTTPHPYTELGFVVATLDSRSAAGRGKRFLDAIYRRLGTVEVDDQAAGVAALRERPWIDGDRVGIFGTSYGGYVSILALLRHPDVFRAASASSPVTDWRHYDTIYTERYLGTPAGNPEGYDAGSAVLLAPALEGDLLLYYGTADNNVHPSNSLQFIDALQRAGKSFEVQVGPDRGHTAVDGARMMEFFIDRLVVGAAAR